MGHWDQVGEDNIRAREAPPRRVQSRRLSWLAIAGLTALVALRAFGLV